MTKMPDVSTEQLLDWLEERLPSAEMASVAQALENANEETRRQVQWLQGFLQMSKQTVLDAPPPPVRTKLMQQFDLYTQSKRQTGWFQQCMAALSFDSALQPALSGLRSGNDSGERLIVFASEFGDVVLNTSSNVNAKISSRTIIGQILSSQQGVAIDAFAVQLLHQPSEKEIGLEMIDTLGEFTFTDLVPGTYSIVISSDQQEIILPAFEVQ